MSTMGAWRVVRMEDRELRLMRRRGCVRTGAGAKAAHRAAALGCVRCAHVPMLGPVM